MKFRLFGKQKEDGQQFILMPRQDEAYRKERDLKAVIKSFQMLEFHSCSEKLTLQASCFSLSLSRGLIFFFMDSLSTRICKF